MKHLKISFLFFALFGIIISCSSDDESTSVDENPDLEICEIPNISFSEEHGFTNPCAIAVSPEGRIAITTYNGFENGYGSEGITRIWASYSNFINNEPPILPSFPNIAAEGATFDTNGNLYITETEQVAGVAVYLKNQNGYTYSHTIQGNLNNPRGTVFDQGKLYIADDGNGRVVSVENASNPNYEIQEGFNTNGSVKAITADGEYFYYVQFAENKVVKRSKENGEIQTISVTNPVDITLYDGYLYITSPETNRLTVISASMFSEECMETFDDFGASFATAHYPGKGLLITSHDEDKIKTLSLQ